MNGIKKKVAAICCSLLLSTSGTICAAAASEEAAGTKTGILRIVCENDDALQNSNWRLYRIGTRDTFENRIDLDSKYLDTSIDLSKATDDDMKSIAAKISQSIRNNGYTADKTYTVDSSKIIEAELPTGIYFLEMDPFEDATRTWMTAPAVIEVNDWEDVNQVFPKTGYTTKPTNTPEKPPNEIPNVQTGTDYRITGAGTLLISLAFIGSLVSRKRKEDEDTE